MASESVILTALPNGVDESGDSLRVTVFVTPRLATNGAGPLPLAGGDFPAFADWPATLAQMVFGIEFDGATTFDAHPDPASGVPDSATWHLLFDGCSVRDGEFNDLSDRTVRSFPVAATSGFVLDLYAQVAEASPTAFPPITTGPLAQLGDLLGSLGEHKHRYYGVLDNAIEKSELGGKTGRHLDRPPNDLRLAFAEAYRFYDRPGERDPAGEDDIPPRPESPDLDFHGFVAFCGDYPELLRVLGLAVDVVVPYDASLGPRGRMRVVARGPEPWLEAEGSRPWTRYELERRLFVAEPRVREADLVDGMLRLEHKRLFLVNQIDVDGSALKTVDFAGNLQRVNDHLRQHARSMTEDASSLPSLRSGGFTIARDARAERIVGGLDESAGHEQSRVADAPAELWAEDVNRGYRLDVEDLKRPGRWLSLHERTGRYTVGAEVLPIPPDEGYVKGASASSVPGGDDDLYLHETLVGWDGWSLAAKRPGKAITNTETEDIEQEALADFPLLTSFEPTPGTLPRLRFGRTYRFRSRAVDLAGNSVREEAIDPQHVTVQHVFQRFEPVPSPAVVPRRPYTEGESLMRMVIRSTLGVPPPEYVELARIVPLAYRDANERHLAPPIVSQQLAEWHGRFDDGIGKNAPQPAVDEQFDIAARESGSFLQASPDVSVFNPDPAATPTALTPNREKGAPLEKGEYVYYDTDDLQLPYLPDPLSLGASFTTLPGEAGTRLQRWEAGPDWFDRRPLRIRIEDGSGAPSYDAADRLLTVFLPQAELVTVQLSSFLEPGDLELMGVWMLERDVVRAAQQPDAERGLHWMLTPWQPLTLVHAVEKPLEPPVVNVPTGGVQRNRGETFAALVGAVANHAKSTGRLDVEAQWKEPIDVHPDGPSELEGTAHVGDFQLESFEAACRIGRDDVPASGSLPPVHQLRHEFGDTKHRVVSYRAVATTRFREYFPPQITNESALTTHDGDWADVIVPSSRRPDPPEVLYVIPTWTWDEETVPGRRPHDGSRRLPPTLRRTRSGGGLRVYLDRPWYSSGAGELLGVVLEDQPWLTWPIDQEAGLHVTATAKALADEVAERLISYDLVKPRGRATAPPSARVLSGLGAAFQLELGPLVDLLAPKAGDPSKFVTQWGLDPVWGSAPLHKGPYIHQFPLRVAVRGGVSLLEAPEHTVTVVGHEPSFDPERKLWYCDLQLDAGPSYFPFVRLALARYQPSSIDGEHLSAVVFPDFAQLVAERSATTRRIGRSALSISLRGPGGYTEHAKRLAGFGVGDEERLDLSRFAVAQVERLPAETTTDLAWTAVGDEFRLALSAPNGLADVQFSGRVPLPTRTQGEQFRLALREYEIFGTDESEAEDHISRPSSFSEFALFPQPVRYRLVYADHLPL